jgi:hypothetical protein
MLIENWNHARHFTGALPLLVSRTQKPYARYSRLVGEDRIDSLAVKRADHLLRSGNTLALAIVDDGGISAIAAGSILPWDSRHCGFTAARIDLLSAAGTYGEARKCLEALLPAFLRKCREAGVRHLSARVGAEELALVHTAVLVAVCAIPASCKLVLDGALGHMLQARKTTLTAPADFGGAERSKAATNTWSRPVPDVIDPHPGAGHPPGLSRVAGPTSDIIETNSFGGTALVLAEYTSKPKPTT